MPGADVATKGNGGKEINLLLCKYACSKAFQASNGSLFGPCDMDCLFKYSHLCSAIQVNKM